MSAPVRPKQASFRADIQGLRAVAVLLVAADHFFGHPAGGFIGVDVFFVISGYLITGLLVRERERTDRTSIREFYERRARRILPVAVVVLASTTIAARLIFSATRAHQTYVDSLWSMFFLANVHLASIGTSYFDALRPPSAVQQYWSLAVEEQFYLVWPCALIVSFFIARRLRVNRTRAVVGCTALLMVVVSFALCVHLTSTDPTGSYFSATTRGWELGLGALTAIAQPWLTRLHVGLRLVGGWLGVALIFVAAFVIGPTTPFPGHAAALPVVATALVLGLGEVRQGVGSSWALGNPVSLYIGRISYSLYLWHWPVMIFSKAYYGAGTGAFYTSSVVGTLALSVLSFHLIEDPVRRSLWLARKPTGYVRLRADEWVEDNRRVLIPLSLVVLLLVVGLAWNFNNNYGRTSLTPAEAAQLNAAADLDASTTTSTVPAGPAEALKASIKASLEATSWGPLSPSLDALTNDAAPEWKHDDCLDVLPRKEAQCLYGAKSSPHLALVIGDSIAISYMQGIRAVLPSGEWRVQSLTLHQCPMLDAPTKKTPGSSGPNNACLAHRPWVLNEVQRLKPDLVIEANAFDYVGAFVNGGNTPSEALDTWRGAMTRTLSALVPNAGRVVLLGGPPRSGNLQECVTVRSTPSDCAEKVQARWLLVRDADQAAATAAGATYVDPLNWFCDQNVCPAVIGSTPVYWDGIHMTATYSRSLAPVLAGVLLS